MRTGSRFWRRCRVRRFSTSTAASVVLDSFQWSGGNTSLEALAMGVPVVTLPGRFMRGRVTAAMYRQMGLADMIAADAVDWVSRAAKLATDAAAGAGARQAIVESGGRLFGDPTATRRLEDFLREV